MSEHQHDEIMVDLETLGTDDGCPIVAIGAVRFSDGGLGEEFERSVSLQSCEAAGLWDVDAATLEWWLDQDAEVQAQLTGGDDIEGVLRDFKTFYAHANTQLIWAHSHDFDVDMLEQAFEQVGFRVPWGFRDRRCSRTIAGLDAAVWPDRENRHTALADAKAQAEMVRRTRNRLTVGDGDE